MTVRVLQNLSKCIFKSQKTNTKQTKSVQSLIVLTKERAREREREKEKEKKKRKGKRRKRKEKS